MTAANEPWQIHPDLMEERLVIVGRLLRDVRHDAVHGYFDRDKGDGNWGLGCVTLERTKEAIRKAARLHDWLEVVAERPRFVFAIGQVPMRFYRGDEEDVNPRWLRRSYPEVTRHQLAFAVMQEGIEWFWRLLMETDESGEVVRVIYAEMSDYGDVRNVWEAPLDGAVRVLDQITPAAREGVKLDPPALGHKDNVIPFRAKKGEDDGNGSDNT